MKHEPIWGGTRSSGLCHIPVEYDASNQVLMAQFDGNGGIRKYSVAGKWRMLKEGSWYCGWSVNGRPASVETKKTVYCQGKKQRIEYEASGAAGPSGSIGLAGVNVEQFCHPDDNAIYTVYQVRNGGSEPISFDLSFGFEVDVESFLSYRIRRYGKAEAVFPQAERTAVNKFSLRMDDDFSLHYISSHELMDFVHEAGRCNLHYRLAVGPGETEELAFVLSAGTTVAPGRLDEWLPERQPVSAAVDADIRWLQETFSAEDKELEALYGYCLNASLSSFKDLGGSFRGFFAGIDYQSPPRTYFRDSYWTLLPALPYKPEWVRCQILTLANGILENGSCPSAVIYNQDSKQYEPFWPDHYDSPSFFVMMIYDYLSWTRDFSLLEETVNGNSIERWMELALSYLEGYVPDNESLFRKPDNRRDWADNVVREGLAVYDLALYVRALSGAESVCRATGRTEKSEAYRLRYAGAKQRLQRYMKEDGFFNYMNSDGFTEPNLSIELSLLILYGILEGDEQKELLKRMTEQLETVNNKEQQHGDWGTMAAYPFYRNVHHLVEKTMAPYRYHNGGDWPYWDGIYAWAKFAAGDAGWRYPLTRWFQVSMDNGWLTPVEYYGPVYGKGSNLQGWSSMPAAALLFGGIGLFPDLAEDTVRLQAPPWGDCTLEHIHFRGGVYRIAFRGGRFDVQCSGSDQAETPFVWDNK